MVCESHGQHTCEKNNKQILAGTWPTLNDECGDTQRLAKSCRPRGDDSVGGEGNAGTDDNTVADDNDRATEGGAKC